jgi:thioredoxin reductase (NADPH)
MVARVESAPIAIIGAGPIGLEVAVALRRVGIEPLHFDAGQVGSTMQWWAPGTRFFSSPERIGIAGVPLETVGQEKASREEYLAYLRGIVRQFDLRIHTFERVTAIEPRGRERGFLLRTKTLAGEHLYGADRVVAAIGDMHRPRLLNIPGETLPHVSHYFREPHEYFGRRIVIVGGRNSAVEAAIRCFRAGARVTISHRRDQFDPERIKYWLLPEIKHLIKTGQVAHHPLTVPRAVGPDSVTLAPVGTGDAFDVAADSVLLLTGYEMDGSLLEGAGVELVGENRAPQHNPRTLETNVPGLFIAGTAAAGTQVRFKLFIENCHVHAAWIVAAVTGREPPGDAAEFAGPPES